MSRQYFLQLVPGSITLIESYIDKPDNMSIAVGGTFTISAPINAEFSNIYTPKQTGDCVFFIEEEETPDQTIAQSPQETRSISATFINTATFKPTVEGWEYEDLIDIIERGNDFPIIQETHPPIQTKYVKTELPLINQVVGIATGVILIMAILVLSVINFIRSAVKISARLAAKELIDENGIFFVDEKENGMDLSDSTDFDPDVDAFSLQVSLSSSQ